MTVSLSSQVSERLSTHCHTRFRHLVLASQGRARTESLWPGHLTRPPMQADSFCESSMADPRPTSLFKL